MPARCLVFSLDLFVPVGHHSCVFWHLLLMLLSPLYALIHARLGDGRDRQILAESWIRTAREECLDRIIVLNERHLRWVLQEYIRHDNHRRPHRSLKLHVPDGPTSSTREGEVSRHPVLGGLVNDYYPKAA